MTEVVVRTRDGISHGVIACSIDTAWGLLFTSWTYKGVRQGRRNRRRPATQIPEVLMGNVDCMSCLVKRTHP